MLRLFESSRARNWVVIRYPLAFFDFVFVFFNFMPENEIIRLQKNQIDNVAATVTKPSGDDSSLPDDTCS